MKYGLRIPSFALGPRTATLEQMGRYLRRAEDLGFDSAVSIDHLLLTPPAYACTWLEAVTTESAALRTWVTTLESAAFIWPIMRSRCPVSSFDSERMSAVTFFTGSETSRSRLSGKMMISRLAMPAM